MPSRRIDDEVRGNSSAEPGKGSADRDYASADDSASSIVSSEEDAQDGVKGIEAVSRTWTQGGLVAAYLG